MNDKPKKLEQKTVVSNRRIAQEPQTTASLEELLNTSVESLRKAIRQWSRADATYNTLAGIQDGSRPPPVLECTVSHEDKPMKLAFDVAELSEQDTVVMVDLLLGPAIQQYENGLRQIMVASQAAYELLQKQKET